MTDNTKVNSSPTPPARYKQTKRKPFGVLLTAFLPMLLLLGSLALNIFDITNEVSETEGDPMLVLGIFGIVAIVACVITFFISYGIWKSDGFCLLDDGITYDFTFIVKRFVKLPYEKINTVKIKRSFFNILLGVSVVKIGSGSGVTSGVAEISLYFDKKYAQYFMEYLQRRSNAAKTKTVLNEEFIPPSKDSANLTDKSKDCESVSVSALDKMRSAFTHDFFYIGIVLEIIFPIILSLTGHAVPDFDFPLDPASAFLSGIAIVALTIIITIIVVFIRYYDYKIYINENSINISYGLLSKQGFSVSFDKIRGYSIRQGFLQQLLGVGALRLSVVGINTPGSNGQQAITYLYPCAKIKKLNEIIASFLPEFKFEGETITQKQQAYLHNFIIPQFWFMLICLPIIVTLQLMLGLWYLLFIPIGILLLMFISAVLIKRNTLLGFSNDYVLVQTGGYYKQTHIIKMNSVQKITSYAGFIRQAASICTYCITYRGDNPLAGSTIIVKNVPVQSLDKLK